MDPSGALYRQFLSGDKQAFVEIIRLHKDGLILYIYSITKHLGLAEELAEETFVRLVVKKPRFHEKSQFKTWLYAIGRHITVDYLRRSSRCTPMPLDQLDGQTDGQSLEEAYIRKERNRLLHQAIAKLNDNYSQVLYLTYFEDLPRDEVALVMGRSKRQIENLIYHAKAALREQLRREGFCNEGL